MHLREFSPRRTSTRFPVSPRLATAVRSISVLALLVPYIVGFAPSPADSSSFSVTVAGGVGSYAHVSRDCSGNVVSVADMPYDDMAIGVERRDGNIAAGLRAGAMESSREQQQYFGYAGQRVWYANPYIATDGRIVGVQVGLIFFHNAARSGDEGLPFKYDPSVLPSGRLRVGSRSNFHFIGSFASNMPLASGGGIIDAGVGFPIGEAGANGWLGFGFLPYEEGAISFKAEIPLLRNLSLDPRLQFRGGDASEFGLSVGATASF
jgi:hypothetical protein